MKNKIKLIRNKFWSRYVGRYAPKDTYMYFFDSVAILFIWCLALTILIIFK